MPTACRVRAVGGHRACGHAAPMLHTVPPAQAAGTHFLLRPCASTESSAGGDQSGCGMDGSPLSPAVSASTSVVCVGAAQAGDDASQAASALEHKPASPCSRSVPGQSSPRSAASAASEHRNFFARRHAVCSSGLVTAVRRACKWRHRSRKVSASDCSICPTERRRSSEVLTGKQAPHAPCSKTAACALRRPGAAAAAATGRRTL